MSDATTPDRPRADEVLANHCDPFHDGVVRQHLVCSCGDDVGASNLGISVHQLAALRAASGAPDDAPLVIPGDGTLGWLEEVPSRVCCDSRLHWRLAGPQGASAPCSHPLGQDHGDGTWTCADCGRTSGPQGGTE